MKKLLSVLLTLALAAGAATMAVPVEAQAVAAKPQIEDIDYEGGGKVEVDFLGRVQYNRLKVTATEVGSGSRSVKILEKDNDELDFKISGVKAGKTYKFTISGVRAYGVGSYISLSGSIKTSLPSAVKIEETEYEGGGKVEVDFARNVQYKNVKVTLKDNKSVSYSAKILSKDSDGLKFQVSGIRAGRTYTYTISGIKTSSATSYSSVTGKFSVPAQNKVVIEEIEYDRDDRELSIEFKGAVSYKGLKVSIKNSSGKSVSVSIVEKDSEELELRTTLTRGKKYTVTIQGIKNRSASSYSSISKTFTA